MTPVFVIFATGVWVGFLWGGLFALWMDTTNAHTPLT